MNSVCAMFADDEFLVEGTRCSILSNSLPIAGQHSPPNSSHKLVREVVARAVADPNSVLKGIGEPKRAEVQKLYQRRI